VQPTVGVLDCLFDKESIVGSVAYSQTNIISIEYSMHWNVEGLQWIRIIDQLFSDVQLIYVWCHPLLTYALLQFSYSRGLSVSTFLHTCIYCCCYSDCMHLIMVDTVIACISSWLLQ
jgi:hypothetical protein